jgi:capsular polysaccharide transport system permease protein
MPPITFLVSGLVPWLMFSSTYMAPARAISRNRNLLAFPGVTPLDLVLSGCLQIFCTYGLLFIVFGTISSFYENVRFPSFVLGVFLLFICSWLFGVMFGLVLMILTRLYAPAGKFVSFFMRFAMIISGVFISITFFPASVWPYLSWNPMLHVMELMRVYWFYDYASPIARPAYVVESLIVLTFAGLLVERYVRRRLPA